MKVTRVLVGAALCALASTGFASTLASTSFDDSADGWAAQNGSTGFLWVATGGDTGGFVQAADRGGNGLWFFEAPSAYLGNQTAAYGGMLSYSLESAPTSPPIPGSYANVQLLGANNVLLAFGGDPNPAAGWTQYGVSLVADGSWHIGSVSGAVATQADMLGVLANLKDLRIRGDYKTAIETTGLDSVVLTSAVPEPGTYALMLAGLGAVVSLARRRARGNNAS